MIVKNIICLSLLILSLQDCVKIIKSSLTQPILGNTDLIGDQKIFMEKIYACLCAEHLTNALFFPLPEHIIF